MLAGSINCIDVQTSMEYLHMITMVSLEFVLVVVIMKHHCSCCEPV